MFEGVSTYFPQLLDGLVLTLQVALGSFLVGFVIAMVAAPLRVSGGPVAKRVIGTYVTVVRGLPELLIIFLVFYGGTVLLTKLVGSYVEVDALTAGIAALSVVSGAYLTEILRAALLAVPIGQWEAAKSLGLRPKQAFFRVILPQMLQRALPGLGNQWLVILKESALVSIVGLEELMRKSVVAAGATHNPLGFYLTAALLYVLVTTVSTIVFELANRRLSIHAR
ncbi:MAG TPA: ABC transporter permease subunit [Pararhizobium sp.]|uniref:ABC transporter permease n=1 Tax=Pararhizobium sp. TaxID=1977563 RepID=UPI002CD3C29B|nr:ABC transporter permease subunit [Pararhizobium sp.]HTO31517.1 ABC transporter permease subunit [Pararhizobium sp.]